MKICVAAWCNYRALDKLNQVSNFVTSTQSSKKKKTEKNTTTKLLD